MEQDASIPRPARAPRKRRGRMVLIVILLGAVFAGWWWFTRPKEMRLVTNPKSTLPGVIPADRPVGSPPEEKYIVPDYDNILTTSPSMSSSILSVRLLRAVAVMRKNGELVWQADVPPPRFPTGSDPQQYREHGSALYYSANGQYCAVAVVDGDEQQIIQWHNGRRVGVVRLPCKGIMAYLTVTDSGQVYGWIPFEPTGRIYLIEGDHIKAEGTVTTPPKARRWRFSPEGMFLPDGSAFITADDYGFTFYRLRKTGSKLSLFPVYTASEPRQLLSRNLPILAADNFLIAMTGATYNDKGKISNADGWIVGGDNAPPYTAIVQHHLAGLSRPTTDRVRIWNPHTGEHWTPGKQYPERMCVASPDGRYALIDEQPRHRYRYQAMRIARMRYLPSFIKRPIKRYAENRDFRLVLYERPGRARAFLRIEQGYPQPAISHAGRQYLVMKTVISPDGHTIDFAGWSKEDPNKVLTYRW